MARIGHMLLAGAFCLAATAAAFAGESTVTQPEPGPPEVIQGAFSIAVLGDTQNFAAKYPDEFLAQFAWLAENVEKYNVKYVLHLGDVVEHNDDKEWTVARKAFDLIEGRVPYAIAVGNHDMGPNGRCGGRDSLLSKFFPVADFREWPSFGGLYDKEPEKLDNSYHLFSAGGRNWLVLSLEFGPRDDVLRWANEVVARHPDRSVIMITHAYLATDGTRFDRTGNGRQPCPPHHYSVAKQAAGLNDGEQIWQKLVSKHANFQMVIGGHVPPVGLKYLVSKGERGNAVHQMVMNYQHEPRGGDQWLRLLQFLPEGKTVRIRDYSPLLNQQNGLPATRVEFKLSRSIEKATR